ncbi:hypothetical protein BH11PLA2_BH11PLA2_26480 [soil metagenome]
MTSTPARPGLHLAIVSALVLFLELTLIRWLPAHVLYLTFFTNTVLLASFVGMCLGCLTASRPVKHILYTPLWLGVTVAGALLLQSFGSLLIDVASQTNPDVVFFGTEAPAHQEHKFAMPVEFFMVIFFVLAAICMIGPGQEMGRAFATMKNRTAAYTSNLLGSLFGIAAFGLCSELQLPPIVWFAVVGAGLVLLMNRGEGPKPSVIMYAFVLLILVASLRTSGLVKMADSDPVTTWSPYYRIDYQAKGRQISTNMIGQQFIEPRENPSLEPYTMPYLFQRDVKKADGSPAWPAFKRVLIIGAGSGNDLSRACQWCLPDAKIDAVEIDPVIQSLGKTENPDKPYSDPRVNGVLNDGRNFLRRAPAQEYDLVIFALVDSLVLHSGYSNLRLESFLFTEDSFKDVRRVLKPSGVCAVYNFFRQGWIAVRLKKEMETAFGGVPVVLTDPPVDMIKMNQFDASQFTAFFCGTPEVVEPLRAMFAAASNSYWVPGDRAIEPTTPAAFQKEMPTPLPKVTQTGELELNRPAWVRLRVAEVEPADADLGVATDDWPFLYSRRPGIPGLTWRGVGLVLLLSAGLWFAFVGRGGAGMKVASEKGLMFRSFLLGAGFMLVETKAVVHMALLFGSTWKVNTFVFAAVLMMSLAGNLYAGWVKPKNLVPYYIGLIAALIMNVLVPLDAFLGLDMVVQVLASCTLAFLPIAFAGVIFATSFAHAKNPDRVFGANVAGALIGGLAENLSMVLGFRYLLLVALAFYALSSLCRVGKRED